MEASAYHTLQADTPGKREGISMEWLHGASGQKVRNRNHKPQGSLETQGVLVFYYKYDSRDWICQMYYLRCGWQEAEEDPSCNYWYRIKRSKKE